MAIISTLKNKATNNGETAIILVLERFFDERPDREKMREFAKTLGQLATASKLLQGLVSKAAQTTWDALYVGAWDKLRLRDTGVSSALTWL